MRSPLAPGSMVPLVLVSLLAGSGGDASAAIGDVLHDQKITMGVGGFTGPLRDDDWFGFAVAPIGDFDGDGVTDLAVGAGFDDDGGYDRGAVWMLMMHADGTVKSQHKISDRAGGFAGGLRDGDCFGRSVVSLGDLDGDGVTDIAVGSRQDDDGGFDRGAIWVLFLAPDASVKSFRKISSTAGGLGNVLHDNDWFGISLANLGDLDGDGVVDLAAGAIFDDGGAVWILFLDPDGTVKSSRKTAGATFGATGLFGESMAAIGDVDGDGIVDLAVAEIENSDGGSEKGAVWILFLATDGSVRSHRKISATSGGFHGPLGVYDHLGSGLGALGDLDGDGRPDLVVGSDLNDDGGSNRGALWLLALNADGSVKTESRISDTRGGFTGPLEDEDRLGRSVVSMGDLDGDGKIDLAAGAIFDDAGGSNRGAVWMLFLDSAPLGPTTTTTTLPPVCGNGTLESGESCDDGGSAGGDGCSGDCSCESTPDGDGDGLADPCDPCPADAANDADGDGLCAGVDPCPRDAANDADGDGVCGDVDDCASVANPSQQDDDGDGVGDACDVCPGSDDHEDADGDSIADGCDPCLRLAEGQVITEKVWAMFRFLVLHGPSGNERFQFNGEFDLPPDVSFDDIDPRSRKVRLLVSDYSGGPLLDALLPLSDFQGAGSAGWKRNSKGTRWRYKDLAGAPSGGIVAARIDDLGGTRPGHLRFSARGKGTYVVPFGVDPLRVVVDLGSEKDGRCGETHFGAADCHFEDGHSGLVCGGR